MPCLFLANLASKVRRASNRSCLQFPADETRAGDVCGDVEYLDVPLEAQLEEGLAQLQVTRVVIRQLVRLLQDMITLTEIG